MYSRENEQTNKEATNNNPKNLKFTSWGVKKKPLQQQQQQQQQCSTKQIKSKKQLKSTLDLLYLLGGKSPSSVH